MGDGVGSASAEGKLLAVQTQEARLGRMFKTLATLAAVSLAPAALAQSAPLLTDEPELTLQQQTTVRCGTAFALANVAQELDEAWAADFPEIGERGREYFVRSSAQLMDDTGMTREQVEMLYMQEASAMGADTARIVEIMPACLSLLDASGL